MHLHNFLARAVFADGTRQLLEECPHPAPTSPPRGEPPVGGVGKRPGWHPGPGSRSSSAACDLHPDTVLSSGQMVTSVHILESTNIS